VRAAGIEEVSVSKLISPPVGPHLISGMRDIGGFAHDDLTVSPHAGMMTNPRTSRNEGLDFAALQPDLIVRTGDNKGGFSLDSGHTWTEFPARPPINMDQGGIAVSADGTAWVWASSAGIAYFTRDRGASWSACAGLPEKTVVISDRVTPNVFYALDTIGRRLLVSTDGGATFASRNTAVPEGFNKIFASPHGASDLWTTGRSGLMRSGNGGTDWTKVSGVPAAETLGFGKAAPRATYPAIYLVGTTGGVRGIFRSDDSGQSWGRINDDRHQWGYIGQSITGDPRVYGRVFIATNGRGVIWGEMAGQR
jgi:hypothetical protein